MLAAIGFVAAGFLVGALMTAALAPSQSRSQAPAALGLHPFQSLRTGFGTGL